ncbi:MAG: signal recognition particle-docking protein FtsY [Rhodospirillaceae bacterium]|nr:signal recognition particle-docking protein FtsY [Rhodospirillaceae bacterium]|tara:strand:+ start:19405 stop:20337 length:933 start_codon:yes stop_codon:yes gene_type:complete
MSETSGGWLSRLKSGLSRTSEKLSGGISSALTGKTLDAQTLERLEEALIGADLGVSTAAKLSAALAKEKFDKEINDTEVREALAQNISSILEPVAVPLEISAAKKPHVILVVGVNGSGKTTTIGKLAKNWVGHGKTVVLAAGDTFRAAAVEQLKIWGERTHCKVIARDTGSDAAGLAFEALEQARNENADILLIDTAGRLQNRDDLMGELAKIIRVLQKLDPEAPHSCLLVLDATVGQNAHSQVETFKEMTDVSGLVMTKLDGTARGGVVVALAERFGLPVHAVGVGEGEDDLQPFDHEIFARNLLGLNP